MANIFSEEIIRFYSSIKPPKVDNGIEVLYPQKDPQVMELVRLFANKYYNDTRKRTLIFGINPGRFGAGTTGINFTGPRQLKSFCEIDHPFRDQTELSAEFIYEMITAYGGCDKFYAKFFITAVCPLGFIKEGKNLNYYDDKSLKNSVTPFIIDCVEKQLQWNVNRKITFCIGGEKNFKFFSVLNEKQGWFKKVVPLPHPRFIMQYRRKRVKEFIEMYLSSLRA